MVHQETQKVADYQLAAVLQIAKNAVEEERDSKVAFAKVLTKLLMITLLSMNNILIFMKSRLMLPQNYG